jgi:hypothetical protein
VTALVITVVIGICSTIFASVTAPILLARRTEQMHREDMLADYQRQDRVAAEAAKVAAVTAQTAAAAHSAAIEAHQAASAISVQAAVNAGRLDVANSKLDVIHGLVNSNYSAAMQSQLDALVNSAALMREVIDLKKGGGAEPSQESVIALADTESKITDLRASIADRLAQAESIAGRAAVAVASAQDAAEAARAKAVPR